MRLSSLIIAAAIAAAPAAVLAQAAPAPGPGKMLVTSDGKRVGQIDRIVRDAAGSPRSAAVIYNSRFVYVPYETLGSGDNGRITTSLTQKDVRSLR